MAKKEIDRRSMRESPVIDPALTTIEGARPEPARGRNWEREQRSAGQVATYRGIPLEVRASVKRIASALQVPIGMVAGALLRYAVEDYEAGRLVIESSPTVQGEITRLSRTKGE